MPSFDHFECYVSYTIVVLEDTGARDVFPTIFKYFRSKDDN